MLRFKITRPTTSEVTEYNYKLNRLCEILVLLLYQHRNLKAILMPSWLHKGNCPLPHCEKYNKTEECCVSTCILLCIYGSHMIHTPKNWNKLTEKNDVCELPRTITHRWNNFEQAQSIELSGTSIHIVSQEIPSVTFPLPRWHHKNTAMFRTSKVREPLHDVDGRQSPAITKPRQQYMSNHTLPMILWSNHSFPPFCLCIIHQNYML